jgi:RHS repeat-associated protein
LTSETIDGIYDKVITRSYETTGMIGRYAGMNIGTEYNIDYGYDQYGRFNSVTNGSDTFTYSFLTNSNLVQSLTAPNNITVTNAYESNRNLLTSVENKHSTTQVSKYTYRYDDIGRRKDVVNTGTAFTASNLIKWTYNDRSEVTDADKYNSTDPDNPTNAVTAYDYALAYDTIGNRSSYNTSTGGTATTYTANALNQYTAVDVQSPTYDDDGNQTSLVTSTGTWSLSWNGENRMSDIEKTDQKLDFLYDSMGRRVRKQVYSGSSGSWTLDKQLKFVYNGYKLIEELDGQNSDAVLKKIVWSGEKPLSIYDANLDVTYYYVLDANKNVSDLIDASGNVVAHYEYSPFGKIIRQTGSYAAENPIRFSSEYFDKETGLVYYNFRYYIPGYGRWTKRDPIEEDGGYNLYGMLDNDAVNGWDVNGLTSCCGDKAYDPSSSCCKNNKIVPVQKAKCSYLRAAINALRNILKSTQQTLNDINDIIYNQSLANASGDFIRDSGFWAYSVASAGQGAVAMQAGKAGLKQLANVYGKLRGFGDIAAGYSAGMSLDVFKQRPFVASKENQALKRRAEKQTAEALAKIQKYRQVLSNTCCK